MDREQKEKLSQLGVIWEKVMETFAGHDKIYYNLLKKLPEDEYFKKAVQAVNNSDYQEAFEAVHTLKGVCANLGLNQIMEQLNPLVELLRHEPYATEIINVYMRRLEDKYVKAMNIISDL